MKTSIAYVVEDMDRHGNVRLYFRRVGKPKIRLPGPIGSEEFWTAYRRARDGEVKPKPKPKAAESGTLRHICERYFAAAEFTSMDESTKRARRLLLDAICEKHGDKPHRLMEPRHVRKLRDERAETPAAANAVIKALRQVFALAVVDDLSLRNPARDVPYLRISSDGHHAWTIDEVRQYEAKHPVGTRARLALALLLYTAQRRSDVILFGRQHVKDGWLKFTQAKNRKSKPVKLEIPVLPALQAIIDATPSGTLTFLATPAGTPYKPVPFSIRFRKWCDEAGLPHCSAHGLRKATSTRLAELGCTPHEIMAITGHRTLKEVERYTQAAQQKKLAKSAMRKLTRDKSATKVSHSQVAETKSGTLSAKNASKINAKISS